MPLVELTKGFVATVDEADLPIIEAHSWYAMRPRQTSKTWYAASRIAGKIVLMHRFLTGAEKRQQVDHSDRDGLNNRRKNLRVCSPSQNGGNRAKAYKNTGYKGVYQSGPETFLAYIRPNRHKIHLGSFRDPVSAAQAYDAAARQHFGEFARPNFSTQEQIQNAA